MSETPGSVADVEASTVLVLVQRIEAQDRSYVKARLLADPLGRTAIGMVEDLAQDVAQMLDAAGVCAFLTHCRATKAKLARLCLLVAARLALMRGDWAGVAELAYEVVARDHHDLLSQRLIDAAHEQSPTLETEADRWLATRTCNAPFRQIESRTNGMVHFCCSAWQPAPIGSLVDTQRPTTAGFWNSDRAREIRRSVLDGDFSHCSRWHCPSIAARRLPPRIDANAPDASVSDGTDRLVARKGPARVILSHDRSCNLSCPSCRTEVILMNHAETGRLNALFEDHLLPLLAEATDIKVTGSGDPFGSRHFRHVLARLTEVPPTRRIQLHTNGLLANPRAWEELRLGGHVSSVWVSIDAARPETYAVLRRGGTLEALVENLHFLGGLRQTGQIDALRLDFVVQAANYTEIGEFVDLAESVGADGTYFLRLRNWGHFPVAEFRAMDVCSAEHPEHGALLNMLADPRIGQPGVDMGSLSPLVTAARGGGAGTTGAKA